MARVTSRRQNSTRSLSESTNLPKHSRKLFDRSFPCAWDGARRPGCAEKCSCGWTERCHPSFVFVPDNTSSGRHGQLVDVGVCGMDFRVPVLVSLLLPVLLLTCLISVRRIMTDAVYSELKLFSRESRRMDDLCNKKFFKGQEVAGLARTLRTGWVKCLGCMQVTAIVIVYR
ncbi:unnamed protein product [Symbiodinium necroappetens]|uniref:Uncharacterized protein n=1 Tax=Symbiodinium necroappetens TaxID=1628268 RepID=A0A812KQP0_9DINO|nr:unnamed protein product [Symbiodinium necroappetens]